MTVKEVKDMAKKLYDEQDMDSYTELWDAIRTLDNLGLIDRKYRDALIALDNKMYKQGA